MLVIVVGSRGEITRWCGCGEGLMVGASTHPDYGLPSLARLRRRHQVGFGVSSSTLYEHPRGSFSTQACSE